MDRIFGWLKSRKNWKWLILGAFAVFFIPLVIIHLLFKIPYINDFLTPAWQAGEILGYVGAFYALLGTAIFGSLTLWQNHLLREKTETYQKILDQENKKRNMPELIVNIARMNGLFTNIEISILNDSDNTAKNIKLVNVKILDTGGSIVFTRDNITLPQRALRGGEKAEAEIKNPSLKEKNMNILATLQFEDKFLEWHEFVTSFLICDPNSGTFKITRGKIKSIVNPE